MVNFKSNNNGSKYGKTCIIEDCRINYVNIADIDKNGKYATGKYAVTLYIQKDNKADIERIKASILSVNRGAFKSLDELVKHPLIDDNGDYKDGDAEKCSGLGEIYENSLYFKTTSNYRPSCFKLNKDTGDIESITNEDAMRRTFYAGCHVSVELTPFVYKNKGVTFFLKSICFIDDGERVAGREDSEYNFRSVFSKPEIKEVEQVVKITPSAKKVEELPPPPPPINPVKGNDLSSLFD